VGADVLSVDLAFSSREKMSDQQQTHQESKQEQINIMEMLKN